MCIRDRLNKLSEITINKLNQKVQKEITQINESEQLGKDKKSDSTPYAVSVQWALIHFKVDMKKNYASKSQSNKLRQDNQLRQNNKQK